MIKQRILTLAILLLTVWWAVSAASVADKGIYRIVNAQYDNAMTSGGAGNITCSAVDQSNEAQLWIAEAGPDGGFFMRNYKTGFYMTSSRARSKAWTTQFVITPDPEKTLMKFTANGDAFAINTVNATGQTTDEGTHGYAHENNQGVVVGWNTNAQATLWRLESVSVSEADIEAHRAQWSTCVSEIFPAKAYRIRNYNYNDNLAQAANGKLVAATPDMTAESQIWVVDKYDGGDGYVIRNYASGKCSSLQIPKVVIGCWQTSMCLIRKKECYASIKKIPDLEYAQSSCSIPAMTTTITPMLIRSLRK